jgi:hypothetical protein
MLIWQRGRRRTGSISPALAKAFEEAERATIREEICIAMQFADELAREHGHPFPDQRAMFVPAEDTAVTAQSSLR